MNIAFIPARCGSISIPFKNIKQFCGKPLIYWCLNALEQASQINKIFVATDCDEIERVVDGFNFSKTSIYRREKANASATASTESVMMEFISAHQFSADDNFVLVQATNPFLLSTDIDAAFELYQGEKYDSIISCCRAKRFFWNEDGTPVNYDYNNRPRRQDFAGTLVENGSFYINSIANIIRHKNRLSGRIGIYEMSEYSYTEIDEEDDWIFAEGLFSRHFLKHEKREIKIVLSDVDGVLTDAGMYYSNNGDELKKFNTYDGYAFKLLQKQGIKVGIITGEDRNINVNRAKKLKLDFAFHGISDKWSVLQGLCEKEKIDPSQVAFVGDDLNDLEILQNVGMAACPTSAMQKIKEIPGIIILSKNGGDGVIREFVDKYFADNE
jgi:N-acylneuraminate cytidylyltransferase